MLADANTGGPYKGIVKSLNSLSLSLSRHRALKESSETGLTRGVNVCIMFKIQILNQQP